MRIVAYRFLTFLIVALLVPLGLSAQQKHITRAAKKKEQVEQSYKKAYAKARKATIKHRYAIQSKSTQEMMDASEKRARSFNRQNDPPFLERIFKRKRPKCR